MDPPLYWQIINLVFSDPKVAFAVIVQILMGVAPGYYMSKVIKYFVALITRLITAYVVVDIMLTG